MALLTRKSGPERPQAQRRSLPRPAATPVLDRRRFLTAAGLAGGVAALVRERPPRGIGEAQAQEVNTPPGTAPGEVKHTVCSQC